jgi:hypothetical protein
MAAARETQKWISQAWRENYLFVAVASTSKSQLRQRDFNAKLSKQTF